MVSGCICGVHMYPQWANNPPQGLDRYVLTVRAISVDLEPAIDTISPVMNLHDQLKARWKSIPVHTNQWKQ